ncbi:MAG: ATP-binding cassette domain-containing protein, partial [Oscillospiraceae bacterium]|nr:ATP-binding cassette domain-containing protein [Oscillospiraceae bacterium]
MKVPADEIKKKVDWAVRILGLEEYRKRKPKNLSGGQRQRVALGRAIVKNQKVFLMDEPLSNLDAKLRVSMRNEISKLHRELGSTTIYVTHDQVEAMTMADRIVIMKDGIIQQVGKPMELYEHPVNKFVAGFIGSPQMNFYDVTVKDNTVQFADGSRIILPENIIAKLDDKKDGLILGIRGEDIKLDAQNLDLYKDSVQHAVVENTEVMGNENNLYFNFGGVSTVARVSKYEISQIGDRIDFVFSPARIHFFDKTTEESLF